MKSKADYQISSPSDWRAFLMLISPSVFLGFGIYLLFYDGLLLYLGILLLSIFFAQSFILLHECAHLSFFETRFLNIIFGYFFAFFSLIPFYTWQQMHNLHHRWTGWRDKDPTTENTVAPSENKVLQFLINLFWWTFIPVFFMSYQFDNYWNPYKLKRFLSQEKFQKSTTHLITSSFLLVLFVLIGLYFLPILLAFGISLVWKELLIMTQHSHIEIPVSEGKAVKPISYSDQIKYTRSFKSLPFIDTYLLFNFNQHEVHHAQPGLPCYRLVNMDGVKPVLFPKWFIKAKGMKGVDYVFRTSKHSGKEI